MKYLLIVALFLTGCISGGFTPTSPQISTRDVWPQLHEIGAVTVLQDQRTGDLTTITAAEPISRACAPASSQVVSMNFTKNANRAYWNPNYASSLQFLIATDTDGTIRAIGLYEGDANNGGNITLSDQIPNAYVPEWAGNPNYPQTAGQSPEYVMFAPEIANEQSYETADNEAEYYNQYIGACVFNDPGLLAQATPSAQPGIWMTKWEIGQVDTPVYKGEAVIATYAQGWYIPASGVLPFCAANPSQWGYSEKWYFATDSIHGLVEIEGDIEGSGSNGLPATNGAAMVCALTNPIIIKAISEAH